MFKSIIDFIGTSDVIYIFDWKSFKTYEKETKFQVSFQLSLYYYWAKLWYPDKGIIIGYLLDEEGPRIRFVSQYPEEHLWNVVQGSLSFQKIYEE